MSAVSLEVERCRVRVSLESFEGSLDTLIELVRRDESMLMGLELHRATEQLLAQAAALPLEDAAVAVALSAQLVSVKAELLRRIAGAPDEDPASRGADETMLALLLECRELVRQHREEGGGRLARSGWVAPASPRRAPRQGTQRPEGPGTFTLEELIAEVEDVEREITGANRVERDPFRRAEILKILSERLAASSSLTFGAFDGEPLRLRLALFLLILEEVRAQRLRLHQAIPFGEIEMERRS